MIIFFFNDTATTEIYTLSLHDALPIYESFSPLNDSLRQLVADTLGFTNPICTIITVSNVSDVIAASNYDVVGCKMRYAGVAGGVYNNTRVNVTYSYNAKSPTAANVLQNVSGGTERFFQDAGTWFILLSVVIIILIIAVVVVAVSRFGQTTGRTRRGNIISGGVRSSEFQGL